MNRLLGAGSLGLVLLCHCALAQVIEVESKGLKYQTLTRSGITITFTHLQGSLHQYAIIQVAVSNGSPAAYIIRPEDFTFERTGGPSIQAVAAHTVVDMLLHKATGNDAVKLVTTYENGIYGNAQLQSSHGYQSRREAAIAATGTKVKTAVLASALALVQTKLAVGDSTDGAVFFPTDGKPLGSGRLVVHTNTDTFQFNAE